MALRNPWLGALIEAELEEVIRWKTTVKQEHGAPRIAVFGRLGDDASNFKSNADCTASKVPPEVQLLQMSSSKVNQVLISDGDAQMKASLSPQAWASYESAFEEGQAPSVRDLISCEQITVISTPFGPSDERVQLLIKNLEYVGKFRKILGDPKPIEERPRIQELLAKITEIREKQDNNAYVCAVSTEGSSSDGAADSDVASTLTQQPRDLISSQNISGTISQAPPSCGTVLNSPRHVPSGRSPPGSQASPGMRIEREEVDARSGSQHKPGGAKRAPALLQLLRNTDTASSKTKVPPAVDLTNDVLVHKRRKPSSDAYAGSATQAAFHTQVPHQREKETATVEHDVGMAPGINNSGPLPPASKRLRLLHQVNVAPQSAQKVLPERPSDVLTLPPPTSEIKEPAVQGAIANAELEGRMVSTSDTAPPGNRPGVREHKVSASQFGRYLDLAAVAPQIAPPDTLPPLSTGTPSQSLRSRLKRHKIPADQMLLLDTKSAWVPSLPGQQLPHPNVPVALLQAWNASRASERGNKPQFQPSIDISSDEEAATPPRKVVSSGQEMSARARSDEVYDHEHSLLESDDTNDSEDEILDWPASPEQRMLPLDSSAVIPTMKIQNTPSKHSKSSLGAPSQDVSQSSVTKRNGMFGVSGVRTPEQHASLGASKNVPNTRGDVRRDREEHARPGNFRRNDHRQGDTGRRRFDAFRDRGSGRGDSYRPSDDRPIIQNQTTADGSMGSASAPDRAIHGHQHISDLPASPGNQLNRLPGHGHTDPTLSVSSRDPMNGQSSPERPNVAPLARSTTLSQDRPDPKALAKSDNHTARLPMQDCAGLLSQEGSRAPSERQYLEERANATPPADLREMPGRPFTCEQPGLIDSLASSSNMPDRPRTPDDDASSSLDELQMEVPGTLDDDRAGYRDLRSGYFRAGMRRAWLATNFTSDVRLHVLVARYRTAYPKDPVTLPEFAAAIAKFTPNTTCGDDDAHSQPAKLGLQVLTSSPPAMDAGIVETVMQIDRKGAFASQAGCVQQKYRALKAGSGHNSDAYPRPESADAATSVDGSRSAVGLADKRRIRERGRGIGRSRPYAGTLEPESAAVPGAIIDLTQEDEDDTSGPQLFYEPRARTAQEHAPNVEGKGEAELPNRDTSVRAYPSAPPVSVFTEFAQAWHAIRPGGAFAQEPQAMVDPVRRTGHLDILSWGFK